MALELREACVPFNEARKLAQSCGLDLAEEWSRRGGVVKKEQEFVRLLGPHQREMEHLAAGQDLIDVLHHALRLWEKGDRTELIGRLSESSYGRSEACYRVAQAISECLPIESKEKTAEWPAHRAGAAARGIWTSKIIVAQD
ncbi:hypothetical protein [Roseiflexus sp.]